MNIRGRVEKVSRAESKAYFTSRPYGSQIGAHASIQSTVIPHRPFLEERFAVLQSAYPEGHVPLPEAWGGYRLLPEDHPARRSAIRSPATPQCRCGPDLADRSLSRRNVREFPASFAMPRSSATGKLSGGDRTG